MILKSKCYGNLQLWNWRQRSKSRCERIHRGNPLHPSNRTLIVQKLTDEAPAAPESVYGLETIEDVFQRFEPTVDLRHVDAEGNEIKEIMTFTGLGDFGAKKIKEKSDFLSKLDIEKEQGVRITRQLTSNRALQKALEIPEVKNAIMDVIESSIEEILANQKKVEL